MKFFLLVFTVFSFFIDSGGPIGIRNLSLIIVVMYAFAYIYKNIYDISRFKGVKKIAKSYIFFSIFYLSFILFGFLSASINQISFGDAIKWLLPLLFYFVFLFYFSSFKFEVLTKGISLGSFCFAFVILAVFFTAVLVPIPVGKALFEFLSFMPGWFYYRQGGAVPNYPNIYFQATLCLTSFSIMSYIYGYKKITIFILLSLAFSLSRTGIFIAITFIVFYSFFSYEFQKRISNLIQFIFFFMVPMILIIEFVIFLQFQDGYVHSYNGLNIRIGHVISAVSEWDGFNVLFGSGPGSYFFSIGVEKFVDNIEVSQVEMLRKYGLIGSLLFHLSLVFYLKWLTDYQQYALVFVVFSFYIVSFTNPVLTTFLFSMLLGITTAITIKGIKR
ncbi:hypothetical protein MX824_002220 [Vibrio parahaemolyticus]|nr:hypothetical protein [Vibrio parahaemolyticus]EJC6783399.1 hypothetical protein [Vibrio parahaemolyticus]EJC6810796.1 hypothetical protein [Vibrio parahaemolyticus]EJC6925329.1 hypothetical protein [Vibrio parahaemolyticus]EJC6939073.1 hypothetical protein [Vibrio parahaemolyticus]